MMGFNAVTDEGSFALHNEASSVALADHVPRWALLAAGALLLFLSGYRWGVAEAAWLAPVPFLLVARRARGARAWLLVTGVLFVAMHAQVAKIVTPPVPPWIVPAYAIPIVLGMVLALAVTEWVRRRAGGVIAMYAFASLTAVSDWLGYGASELGAWSATGNTQVEALPLLQLVAVTGLSGVGFLMAWAAALAALLLAAPAPRRHGRHVLALALVLAVTLVYGALRLDSTHGRTVAVAAVVTDMGLDGAGLPSREALAENTRVLFERTRLAASRGARLVVWNEAATLVAPGDEAPLLARAREEARSLGVDLVLAYGVVLSTEPFSIDNKYAFVTDDGEIAETYRKHHPVPGEPSIRGTDPIRVLDRPYGRVAGAICYDYDFPALAREHARLGAEIVVVPASDWRGIDPVHTLMSRVRAIEGGFSVLRSTRWAASAAFDAYGRVRGWMPVTEENERVMVAQVPVGRVHTLYSVTGDGAVGLAVAALLAALGVAWRRGRGVVVGGL